MTHHDNPELLNYVLQLLTENGHDGFAKGLRLLGNEAMRVERQHVLQAQPYERTDARKGYANGYKPKTLASRLGPITFSIPQVRGQTPFYPSARDKGLRSEQATFHFDTMPEAGDVTVDHMIKHGARGVQEKGPQFKVEDKKRPQLFLGEQREDRFF